MSKVDLKDLLKKPEVVSEINRHKWFESERLGYDIGFEKASEEWLEKFSKAWMSYHLPKQKKARSSKTENKTDETKSKRRRAKTYI